MATYPQSIADYIAGLTDDDFINGGHRTNFIPTAQGTWKLAYYVQDQSIGFTEYVDATAAQVAADAASAAAGSGTEAAVSDIRQGAAAQYLSIRRVLAANEPVSLVRAATTQWDMASGINFDLALDGNVSQLANPTGQVAGKSGVLRIVQDATGGRTLGAYGSNFHWLGGVPRLPPQAGAVAVISYLIWTPGTIYLTYGGDDQ